jgi:hypothetical protein
MLRASADKTSIGEHPIPVEERKVLMKVVTVSLRLVLLFIAGLATPLRLHAQAGFDDDRVLLQGFYWESHRHGDPRFPQFGSRKWYEIVRDKADEIRTGRFDLVWLPPPCCGGNGLGIMGHNADGLRWKQRAVTFLENHDTGYRTNEDATPQEGHSLIASRITGRLSRRTLTS